MSNNANYTLTLAHLYPQDMNIYGDMGNIVTLKQRCSWRGIKLAVVNINQGQDFPKEDADIFFLGGGQDEDMFKVYEDLINYKKSYLVERTNLGKVFLLICGGFQLFGEYFLDAQNRKIHGLGLLPVITKAPGDKLTDRCLGNLVSKINPAIQKEIEKYYPGEASKYLVGFENHSGQTYFNNSEITALGEVVYGKGNNAVEKKDGAKFRNIFGSYSHGSLLPKNPHLADYLISLALENKYGREVKLAKLDDQIEWQAHKKMLQRLNIE